MFLKTRLAEKRRHERAPIEMWVKEENGDFFFIHRASNISIGGVFLEKKVLMATNRIATFFFRLPISDEVIVAGRSVYDTALNPKKTSIGSGVEFIDLTLDAKKLIHEYVTTFHQKRST